MGLYKRNDSRYWWMGYTAKGEQRCESKAQRCSRPKAGLAGLAGGFVLGHYVTSLLFEVKPGHAATVVFPLLGLMLVCLFAALPPTLRASRLNPVVALRQE